MIKIRALFIGGPADGKRMEIDARCQQISVPQIPDPESLLKIHSWEGYQGVPDRAAGFDFTVYRVHILDVRGHGHFAVCTTDFDLNQSDLLVALLEGYSPKKEQQP